MKSKERHELATNELAEVLGRWSRRIRPYLGYILVLIVAVVAVGWWTKNRSRESSDYRHDMVQSFTRALESWSRGTAEAQAQRIESMEAYLKNYRESDLRRAAEYVLAGELYNRAFTADLEGKDSARILEDLNRAEEIYERLSRGNDAVARWSKYDRACVVAMRGEKERAEELLVALAKEYPETPLEDMANQRLDTLRNTTKLVFDEPAGPEPKPEEQGPVKTTPDEGAQSESPEAEAGNQSEKVAPPAEGGTEPSPEGATSPAEGSPAQ